MNIRHPNRNCNGFPTASEATERASESDRLWFEAHPDQDFRIRPIVDGEFGAVHHEIKSKYILVEQVRTGFRLRKPITLTGIIVPFDDSANGLRDGDS